MASNSRVSIAGVGLSKSKKDSSISAATKALLDAGIHFDKVEQAVTSSKECSEALKAFDSRGIETQNASVDDALSKAYSLVGDGKTNACLVLTTEKSLAISLLLVSDKFLWRHPYLKDSAVTLTKSDKTRSSKAATGLQALCQNVFAQRGWAKQQTDGNEVSVANQTFTLSRADTKEVPKWQDVEHKQDGKDRLGHNPADEMREISQEDFEAVRAMESGASEMNFKRRGGDRAALAKL